MKKSFPLKFNLLFAVFSLNSASSMASQIACEDALGSSERLSGEIKNTNSRQREKALLDYLRRQRPVHLQISGDMKVTSSASDFEIFKNQLIPAERLSTAEKIEMVKATLETSDLERLITPFWVREYLVRLVPKKLEEENLFLVRELLKLKIPEIDFAIADLLNCKTAVEHPEFVYQLLDEKRSSSIGYKILADDWRSKLDSSYLGSGGPEAIEQYKVTPVQNLSPLIDPRILELANQSITTVSVHNKLRNKLSDAMVYPGWLFQQPGLVRIMLDLPFSGGYYRTLLNKSKLTESKLQQLERPLPYGIEHDKEAVLQIIKLGTNDVEIISRFANSLRPLPNQIVEIIYARNQTKSKTAMNSLMELTISTAEPSSITLYLKNIGYGEISDHIEGRILDRPDSVINPNWATLILRKKPGPINLRKLAYLLADPEFVADPSSAFLVARNIDATLAKTVFEQVIMKPTSDTPATWITQMLRFGLLPKTWLKAAMQLPHWSRDPQLANILRK